MVMLLPNNRCEQGWWQDLVEPLRDRPGSVLRSEFIRGRPRFLVPGEMAVGTGRPPFGCLLLIWQRSASATLYPDGAQLPFDGRG